MKSDTQTRARESESRVDLQLCCVAQQSQVVTSAPIQKYSPGVRTKQGCHKTHTSSAIDFHSFLFSDIVLLMQDLP